MGRLLQRDVLLHQMHWLDSATDGIGHCSMVHRFDMTSLNRTIPLRNLVDSHYIHKIVSATLADLLN